MEVNCTETLAEHPVIAEVSQFDVHSGVLAERILFNNRRIVIFICLIITLIFGIKSTEIGINASFEKMIPTAHPYIVNFLNHKTDLSGLGNTVRIAVEVKDGTVFTKEYIDLLRKINDEVLLINGVDRAYMKSLWTPSTRWIGVTEEGMDGGPVIPDDYDGSPESIEHIHENILRSGEVGTLIAEDFKSTVISVPLLDKIEATGKAINYNDISTSLEEIRSKYGKDNVSIHIIGFAKVVGDLISGLMEVLLFFMATILIAVGVLYLFTRCIRSAVLVVVCSVVAVIWLLGALPMLGYELDPYSILVPFLVFAIGMSHGAQKMNGIMQDIGRGTHKYVAARYTFRRLFVAGLTALLADAVGFGVLMMIQIRVIHDLAITASLGVAALIFTNLVLLPILLSFFGVTASAAKRAIQNESGNSLRGKHPLWTFLDLFTRPKWALVALVCAAGLGLLGIVVSMNLKIGDLDPGAPELRVDSRYNIDSRFMGGHYAASSDIYVVMVKTKPQQCNQYQTLSQVDALEYKLQQLPGVISTNSLANLSKNAAVGMNEGSLKWYDLPRLQDMLGAIVTRAPRELFNQSCDLLTVYVFLRDHKADTLSSVVAAVEEFARQNNDDNVQFLSAAGNAGIEAATNIVVKAANHEIMILVYISVIILCAITFRSWRAVVCAILPLMLTSVLCEALMVELGIGVKVATLPVIALGVGIGVDYSLYILSVVIARLRMGEDLSTAYYNALIFTGRVVILTGITLGVGVATWVFSPIKFQADMGVLLAFMFIWNMVGALILVPALGSFLLRRLAPGH